MQKPMTYNFIDPIREFELYIIFIQFGGNDIVSEENENINSQFNRIMNNILDLYDELNEFCNTVYVGEVFYRINPRDCSKTFYNRVRSRTNRKLATAFNRE